MTNCPNCGAVRDPAESCCPYCDTPYARLGIDLAHGRDMTAMVAEIQRLMAPGIITANEARALMGLPPVYGGRKAWR